MNIWYENDPKDELSHCLILDTEGAELLAALIDDAKETRATQVPEEMKGTNISSIRVLSDEEMAVFRARHDRPRNYLWDRIALYGCALNTFVGAFICGVLLLGVVRLLMYAFGL